MPEIPVPEIVMEAGTMNILRDWGPMLGQIIAVALVLLFLKRLLKTNTPAVSPIVAGPAGAATDDADEENMSPDEATRRMRREIERAINEDPAAMSRLLESWLTEAKS